MSNEYVHLIDQLHQQVLIVFVLPVWKPDWLPLDHKEKPVYNFQCPTNFCFHSIGYINTSAHFLLTCCGRWRLRSLQISGFWGRIWPVNFTQFFKMLLSYSMICFCRSTTRWKLKSFVINGRVFLSLLSLRNQSLNTGSSWKHLWFLIYLSYYSFW